MFETVKIKECEVCQDTEDLETLLHALKLITTAIAEEHQFGFGEGACYVVVDGAKALVDAYNLAIKTGEIG